MSGLDTQLEDWLGQVKRLVPSRVVKMEMTMAGAKVYEESLKHETKSEHYQTGREIGGVKHLADSIDREGSDVDGIVNGNSIVGFENGSVSGINHGRIARFLNDGTKFRPGDHFVDKTRAAAAPAVFAAERKVYEKHTGGGK